MNNIDVSNFDGFNIKTGDVFHIVWEIFFIRKINYLKAISMAIW